MRIPPSAAQPPSTKLGVSVFLILKISSSPAPVSILSSTTIVKIVSPHKVVNPTCFPSKVQVVSISTAYQPSVSKIWLQSMARAQHWIKTTATHFVPRLPCFSRLVLPSSARCTLAWFLCATLPHFFFQRSSLRSVHNLPGVSLGFRVTGVFLFFRSGDGELRTYVV
ncbi:hypothetical protein EYC84_007810 [Monilinia fructicola]|uniref:Uncharacterized protein n=1 Tax=Monilinia fructicola TaxID=38448 RepID=A0A5M9JH09_MONFR|nr:hypothetical protein EYC84_007810 [Monilinia fructicola]